MFEQAGEVAVAGIDAHGVGDLNEGMGDIAMEQAQEAEGEEDKQAALHKLEDGDSEKAFVVVAPAGGLIGFHRGRKIMRPFPSHEETPLARSIEGNANRKSELEILSAIWGER